MPGNLIYEERISSTRTEVLFVALTLLLLAMFYWRLTVAGPGVIASICLLSSLFFAFYALNYRILIIRISAGELHLKFGLFGWTIPLSHVERAYIDETSLWRICGAGIHFSTIGGRYRAMLNFLEHPRLVVVLKKKRGLVRDVAFSTQRPNEIMRIIGSSTGSDDST